MAVGRRGAVVVRRQPGRGDGGSLLLLVVERERGEGSDGGRHQRVDRRVLRVDDELEHLGDDLARDAGAELVEVVEGELQLRERLLHLLVALDVGVAEHPREHLLRFSASGRAPAPDFALDFDASFGAVLEEVEMDQLQRRPRKMRGFQAKKTSRTKKRGEEPEKRLTKAERKAAKQQKENSGANDAAGPASSLDAPTLASGRRRMMRRFEKKERTKKKKPASDDAKRKKKMTTWDDAVGFDKSISQRDIDKLDRSAHRGGQAGDGVEKVDDMELATNLMAFERALEAVDQARDAADLEEAMKVCDHNMVTSTFSLAGIWFYPGRGQHLCSLKETL